MSDLRTVVYGASDDLIEVEGAYPEEFNHLGNAPAVLSIDDGAILLRVDYGLDGYWGIEPMCGSERVTIVQARGEDEGDDSDGCPGYSQKAVIEGAFAVEYQGWASIVCSGPSPAPSRNATKENET